MCGICAHFQETTFGYGYCMLNSEHLEHIIFFISLPCNKFKLKDEEIEDGDDIGEK